MNKNYILNQIFLYMQFYMGVDYPKNIYWLLIKLYYI